MPKNEPSKLEREFLILGFGTAKQQVEALKALVRESTESASSTTRGGSTAATGTNIRASGRSNNRGIITAQLPAVPPPPRRASLAAEPRAATRTWAAATKTVATPAKKLNCAERERQYIDVQNFALSKARELLERKNLSMPDDQARRRQPLGIIGGITKEDAIEYLEQVRNRIAGWYYPGAYIGTGRYTVAKSCQLSKLVDKVFDDCDFGYLLRGGDLSSTKRELATVFRKNGRTCHLEWNPNAKFYGWAFQLRECLEHFVVRH